MIRNITFASAEAADATTAPAAAAAAEPAQEAAATTLRLRRVTVSPAEEYALRPGAVRPISNELAAAILSRKGRAEVTAKGIVVDRADMGGRNTYWHCDSILCNDLSARERKLFYVVNPNQRDIVHILDDQGCYLESLPLKDKPEVLNTAQQAKAAADCKRQIGRAAAHLQNLHAVDTRERLADLAHNSSEMQRIVQTMPAPAAQPMQPARSTPGEAAAAGARRINDMRASQQSAIALGRAIAGNRHQSLAYTDTTEAEVWSEPQPPTHRHTTQPTPIESW